MKYLDNYEEYNEDIRKSIIGAGLAGSLLFGSPVIANKPAENTTQNIPDSSIIKTILELSSLRKENKTKDPELDKILDDIKKGLYSQDSTKYVELFNKLSSHIESKYGYTIKSREINLEESSIANLGLFAILGWIGSICLAICGVPQAWMSYKDKHSHGISWAFLLLWAFGELFALAYVYDKLDTPLLLNYSVNILIVGLILYYKIKPSVDKSELN